MEPTEQKTEVCHRQKYRKNCRCPRSENHISWWSIRPCAAGGSLCRARDHVAICLRYHSQAPTTASFPHIGAVARPRTIAALLLILALFGTVVGLGTAISSPARTWAGKLPEGIPRLQERLNFLREPVDTLQRFLQQVEDFGGAGPSPTIAVSAQGPTLLSKLFTGTRNFATGFFTTVLFLFFLLVSGDIFLHRLVEILPRFRSKRQVVDISQQIERDISAYLVTITIMNGAVGIATALAMWLTGVGDPILWGTVAFLLNFVPILGIASGVFIFLLAGLLTHDTLWQGLLPAGLYFGIHLIEGETVTPMLLARRLP